MSLNGSGMSSSRALGAAPKKSRFNRPAWSSTAKQSTAPGEDTTEDSFNRSKQTLSLLKRQEAEEKARKIAEAESRLNLKALHDGEHGKADKDTKPSKRRRLSYAGSDDGDSEPVYSSAEEGQREKGALRTTSRSPPRIGHATDPVTKERQKVTISLKDGDEAEDEPPASEKHEKEREVRNSQAGKSQTTRARPSTPQPEKDHASQDTQIPTPRATLSPTPAIRPASPPKPDAPVSILIHSTIPNTEPLLVRRMLTQRVKEVLEAWLKRQPSLSDAEKAEVFLTWRGVKVYAFASCRSLGIDVNEMGEVICKGSRRMEESEVEGAQIEFEATTAEIVARDKRERDAERRRKLVGVEEPASEPVKAEAPKDRSGIRIILKAKDYGDFKLMVKPTTAFSQIATVYRRKYAISDAQDVYCVFDGDRLKPEQTVSSLDIKQEEVLEVMVR